MTDFLYKVEYAKSNNSSCKLCREKISKDVVRFAITLQSATCDRKIHYWHHEDCFFKKKNLSNVSEIEDFDKILHEDQERIKTKIKVYEEYHSAALVLPKTSKIRKRSFEDINLNVLPMFSLEYAKTSSATCRCCDVKISKNDMKISKSNYDPRYGDTPMWYHVSCFVKKRDELMYFASGENIPGFENLKPNDKITIMKEIKDMEDGVIVKKIKENVKIQDRSVAKQLLNTESKFTNVHPLKNLQFYLYGKLKTSKEALKNQILNLGGLVVGKLTDTVAAVVSTKNQLDKKSNILQKIQRKEIEVIEASFFDLIDPKYGTVTESVKLIIQRNIANWKSDPFKRIPQDVIDGKSIPKLGSIYHNIQNTNTKLYVKDGIQIDSRSGLEDFAHIFKEDEEIYSVVLTKANVDQNRNSYYKIELWKSNTEDKYWVFRAWGRIGTTIGGTKRTCYTSIDSAKKEFTKMFTEKTKKLRRSKRNSGGINQDDYSNCIDFYVPIDLNYEDFKQFSFKLDTASHLPKSVQQLVIKTFDIQTMRKTLLQFELDVHKMPLGKLSKSQIKSGYTVLSELMDEFNKNTVVDQKKIKEASNKFYTLIPHSVGVDKLPLLDSPEVVKDKEEMLNNLLEIEVAYKLLHLPSDDSVSPITSHYLKLKADIMPVDKSDPDFHLLLSYIKNTHAPTHCDYTLEVEDIFRVVREGEEERYEEFKRLHNKRLLWHGSRITNLAGILSQGLRIAPPEAPQTGKMFGNGIYFADIVSKSANYCFTNKTSPIGFVFVCEVALGDMKKCYKALKITKLPVGKHSVWGVGQTQPNPAQNKLLDNGVIVPLGTLVKTKENSSLLYNEFIVYDVAQVNVKYLIQFKFNFK